MNAGYSPTSFFALSGWIRSSISYTDTLTSSEGTFDFSFITEHDIPDNGLLEIELPEEMSFSKDAVEVQQIRHEKPSSLVFESLTEQAIVFRVPNGLKSSTTAVEITLEQVLTPRSFRPSSDFKVYTKSEEGYIVDSGG